MCKNFYESNISFRNKMKINIFLTCGKRIAKVCDMLLNKLQSLFLISLGTYQWVKDMHFKDKGIFFNATRYPVTVNKYIEAYYMRYNTFSLYWVLRSGHMVPADNPNAMAKILENLTFSLD